MGENAKAILEQLIHSDPLPEEMKEKIQELVAVSSFTEMQKLLKEITEYKNTPQEANAIVLLINQLYLWTSSKDPLKKTCTRLMCSMDPELIKTVMPVQILSYICELDKLQAQNVQNGTNDNSTNSEIQKNQKLVENLLEIEKKRNNIIVALQGLFGNVPAGVEALNNIIDVLFLYTFEGFIKCFNLFEYDSVPLEIAQQLMYDVTKFLDTLLHHCDTSVHLPAESMKLLVTSYKAMRHEEVTFNTKTHCGALLVMAVVQFPDTIEEDELNTLATLFNISTLKPDDNLLTTILQSSSDCYTTRICIFSGIVHTCPLPLMTQYMVEDVPVAIFIFKKMLEIAMIRSSIAQEIIEISRTLVSLSPLITAMKSELILDVLKDSWDYIWMHLDHFVDSVRNDTQKLLKTVITVITVQLSTSSGCSKPSDNDASHANGVISNSDWSYSYLEKFIFAISEIIQGQNPKFKTLGYIAEAMQVKNLIQIFPDMPGSLLKSLENSSVAQDVTVAYTKLMEQHQKEMPDKWISTWVEPIFPLKHSQNIQGNVLKIFTTAFKLDPTVLLLLKSDCFTEAEYCALLECTIIARNNKLELENVLNVKKHLHILMCHRSPEVRILVLTLIVTCQKSTAAFLRDDFELLCNFFQYNSSSSTPNFRQSMLALYKKAFNRFKDSFYVIQRLIRIHEETGQENAEKLQKFKEIEAYYKNFFNVFFHQQLICGLYAQAEFGMRAMCLELLLHLKNCVPEDLYNEQWRPGYVHSLYAAFDDTYETNLVMLKRLLLELPKDIAFKQSLLQDLEKMLIKPFTQVCYDIKSNVTTSATYAILVHIKSPFAIELIKKAYDIESVQEDEEKCPALLVFRQLSKQIGKELAVAQKDVNIAAKYAPVYGVLFVIRHLILEEELDCKYPTIMPDLITQCLKIVELALPVVNSSAPEGYNPNNLDYERADVTPQLVLHYAWRTIKEVSLLFGEVRIDHPEVRQVLEDNGLLDKIASYFIGLFESAKHRGAYEQGYVGFSKLTQKLWNLKCGWSKLPEIWLENALGLIVSTDAKLCATRRSAGIPFMIQGVLVTEPKTRANKSFHYCMKYLLEIAENYAEENQTAAIHCMNILRALYRHNQLGEVVAGYVSRGVMISITQFSHSEWAIRNSATLMFSALMMRMFGVQRLKDTEDISMKNRLPFKVFKTRYPDLYKFLFAKLEEYVNDRSENVSMYPVLVILGRIYLTFDTKKDDQLNDHLKTLIKATTRTIYKIRELAVSATVTFDSFLKQKLHAEKLTNNQIHGFLMRLKHLLIQQNNTKFALKYFQPLFILISEAGKGVSQTNTTVLMDILIDFLIANKLQQEDLEAYKELLRHLHTKNESTISTCARFQQTKLTLYLHVILKMPNSQWCTRTYIASVILQALASRDEDLNIYALNCIRYISSEKLIEPKAKKLEYEFVKSLSPQTKDLLNSIIRVQLIKSRTFMDLFDILRNRSRRYGLKVCQVLYNYPAIVYTIRPLAVPVKLSHQMILDYLDRQATCINAEMFVVIMGLISKFVAGSNEQLDLGDLIYHMDEFGGEDSTLDERLAIANFLLINCNLLINSDALPEVLRLKLWHIYLDLIQDDEYDVRLHVTQISEVILDSIEVPGAQERFLKNDSLLPERLHEAILAKLPQFIGINEALKVYVKLSLQFDEVYEYTDEKTIYDKKRPHNFKESRQFVREARHFLATSLWKLDANLSYEDKSIFLEEHFLLVSTRLLNIICNQEDTDDRTLCIEVLVRFGRYLERVKVGTTTPDTVFKNFLTAFKAADKAQRAQDKTSCTCRTEVRQFLFYVLFLRYAN